MKKKPSPSLFIRSSASMTATPTRRAGFSERRLLTYEESPHQNIVLVDAEDGAAGEYHEVANSESLFIVKGAFEVKTEDDTRHLGPGDLCHFPPNSSHALRCLEGPGRFLVVFAPGRSSG